MNEPNIPEDWNDSEESRSAYCAGWEHGSGFTCHNVPAYGVEHWTESDGRITADTYDEIQCLHATLCYEAESNSRQFSPFEHLAHELNTYPDDVSEHLWNAFDAGATDRIWSEVQEYGPADYALRYSRVRFDIDPQEAQAIYTEARALLAYPDPRVADRANAILQALKDLSI